MKQNLIKAKRVSKRLRQQDVADYLKISPRSYAFKENGKINFRIDEIPGLIKCLNLTLKETNEIIFNEELPKGYLK